MLSTVLAFLAAPFLFKPSEQEVVPKIDPRSIDGMIAFFESLPADRQYNWVSPRECAMAQWGKSMGGNYQTAISAMDKWGYKGQGNIPASAYVEASIALNSNKTFGAAAQRARAYKKKHGL